METYPDDPCDEFKYRRGPVTTPLADDPGTREMGDELMGGEEG